MSKFRPVFKAINKVLAPIMEPIMGSPPEPPQAQVVADSSARRADVAADRARAIPTAAGRRVRRAPVQSAAIRNLGGRRGAGIQGNTGLGD